jgi:shikimate dehydrogenase
MLINELISEKKVNISKIATNNPQAIRSGRVTFGIANKDYPALTPMMWNAVYEALGMSERNIRLFGEPNDIKKIFDVFRSDPQYIGGDVGVGFKDKSVPYLDEIDPMASYMGAVNLIVKTKEGGLKGFNTDGLGYAQSLEDIFKQRDTNLRGRKVVILGAGGTGNSVVFALSDMGAKLIILNRTVKKAENLASRVNSKLGLKGDAWARFGGEDRIASEVQDADIVVNVSTKGATGKFEKYSALASAKPPDSEANIRENLNLSAEVMSMIPKGAIISDINLVEGDTPLITAAKEAGFVTLDGRPMVVNQAVEAFWILHGRKALDRDFTKEKIKDIIQKAAGS